MYQCHGGGPFGALIVKLSPGLASVLLLLLSTSSARAQTVTCPTVKPGEELRDLPEIRAERAAKKLDTTLRVQLRDLCLPTFRNGFWLNLPTVLRAYGFPDPARPGQWVWGFPGPVLRLRKADAEGGQGDRLSILLRNELPAGSEDNDTNLHFHGGHVSPQFPHDDVMLVLRPGGGKKGAPAHSHGMRGHVVDGETRYQIDPLLWAQPEGTHWYHPHKHGSVSLQVGNGMAGALILHCHFLGHEDRGMMYAVQTVCPKDPGSFGNARPGGQPECVEGNLIEASPKCPAILTTPRK